MSFIIQIIDAALPSDAQQRNNLIDQLIEVEAHHRVGPGEALGTLYQQLVQKYPCISTFDDDELDECVWGDGPLIHNFGQKIAALNINRNEEKVMADILTFAAPLNLKVVDPQSDVVYFPDSVEAAEFIAAIETQAAEEQLTKARVLTNLVEALTPILTPLGFVWSKKELRFNRDVSYGRQYFRIGLEKKSYGEIYIYFNFRLSIDAVIKLLGEVTGEDCSKSSLPFFVRFFTGDYREFRAENEVELEAVVTDIKSLTSEKIVPFLNKLTDLKSIYSTIDHDDKYKQVPLPFSENILALTHLVFPDQVKYVASLYLKQCAPGGSESVELSNLVEKLLARTS
ncbi:hypothetical protein RF679_18590 [Undibacterium cyanobacteriorum]|uniref:Uncharacterized protein n=1 Tax=Undibacterium cyanobacteriorum TaxID=3073561 RepID=A0ABY9RIY5_9BURK|nr:hypothetical protein [Undibacterium sp. 20NA77.5]WMW80625.1 hypothetical protein RF679_18590 [Undibacterium sp. 20NA77.5]